MKTSSATSLVTAAQMRAIEKAAIDSGAVTGGALMERAGRAVVDAIFAHWPKLAEVPGRAIVLCGPGNNGGDGYVIARLLQEWGWEVAVFAWGNPAQLSGDAAVQYARWAAMGIIQPLPVAALPDPRGGVIVDALFGTGLTRGLAPDLVQAMLTPLGGQAFDQWHRVAVDIPSGLCADSGRVLVNAAGQAAGFRADLTVTFHAQKPGHLLDRGADFCGHVVVGDIGLDRQGRAGQGDVALVGPPLAGEIAKQGGHKYDHGHALMLSGGQGCSGAARLAARGALRIGAGLVTVAAPAAAMAECAAQLTAIMLRQCDGDTDLAALLDDGRIGALCLGPGLGQGRARDLVPVALASGRGVVLDADALSAYAGQPDALFSMLHHDTILTPHDGEFARLFPDLAEMLARPAARGPAFSKIDATRAAAKRAGCIVLLKGRDTVIADPAGDCVVHAAIGPRAVPWLATAGAGDVLAGMITGLLARGLPPMQAAKAAAWLHAEAALCFGPGLIAEDLPEVLPQLLRRIADEGVG